MKRAFDIAVSLAVLILSSPIIALAGAGVLIASRGPILYRAARIGRDGRAFEMLKLRTMHVNSTGSVITSKADQRVFRWGGVLRRLKVDELPQFWNVLIGDMAIVGPRPEDPKIVREYYTIWMMETLRVRPGITSIGTIYYYAESEALIDDDDPERFYIERALPAKLAVDRAYLDRATFVADLWCVVLTVAAILATIAGRPLRLSASELRGADRWHSFRLESA